jgi:hypothetical protein
MSRDTPYNRAPSRMRAPLYTPAPPRFVYRGYLGPVVVPGLGLVPPLRKVDLMGVVRTVTPVADADDDPGPKQVESTKTQV